MRFRPAAIGAVIATVAVAIGATLPAERRLAVHSAGVLHPYIHLGVFGLIAWLSAQSTRSALVRVALCLGVALFGGATEFTEHTLYHSVMEWTDVILDAMGAVAGTGLGALTAPSRQA